MAVLLLVVIGAASAYVFSQARGWRHLVDGKKALERDDLIEARRLLELAVESWPESGEAHFYAGRAARRQGEAHLQKAARHIVLAKKYGWVEDHLNLEAALLEVQRGGLKEAEAFLQQELKHGHPESHLILEVLTPAYLLNYHLDQADLCVQRWLKLRPGSPSAWNCKAILHEKRLQRNQAIEAYTEELRLGPDRHLSRLNLVRLLLDANKPADAVEHLATLVRQGHDSVEVSYETARVYTLEGKQKDATELLGRLLQDSPEHVPSLQLLGKIELAEGKTKEAAVLLRKAADLAPFEPDVLYNLLRCLKQEGNDAAVADCERRLKKCNADLATLRELTRQVQMRPLDPEPRRLTGRVYLDNKQDKEGERWLLSALQVSPTHHATHRDLAEYYARIGEPGRAEEHRARGKDPAKSGP